MVKIRSRNRRRIYDRLALLYGDQCWYCNRPFWGVKKRQRTLDHLIPISRGGSHDITNLVLCCAGCNNLKGDRTWWEWVSSEHYQERNAKIAAFVPKEQRKLRLRARHVRSLEVPRQVELVG